MESSRKGHVTLNGFLACWAVTTAADPRRTLAYAYYLGWVQQHKWCQCSAALHRASAVQCARGICAPPRLLAPSLAPPDPLPPLLLLYLHLHLPLYLHLPILL